jgi:hypothetical protein
MTVSEFLGLERMVSATEARRLMDAAQAALYPNIKPEHARRLWSSWERMADPPPPAPDPDALFTWNGKPVEPLDLRRRLAGHLGAGYNAGAELSA